MRLRSQARPGQDHCGSPAIRRKHTGGPSPRGPLKPHPANPRHFAASSGKPVSLTGSHAWANLQDIGLPPIPQFDWPSLNMMTAHNHKFHAPLALVPQAAWAEWTDDKILFDPPPYLRPGPRNRPRRSAEIRSHPLQSRLLRPPAPPRAAGPRPRPALSVVQRKQAGEPPHAWPAHPYNGANNINRFDAEKGKSGTVDLSRGAVREMHAAYLRRVIGTVFDLDNVLYEVINEGGQKRLGLVGGRSHPPSRSRKGARHSVGITGAGAEPLEQMLASPAERHISRAAAPRGQRSA